MKYIVGSAYLIGLVTISYLLNEKINDQREILAKYQAATETLVFYHDELLSISELQTDAIKKLQDQVYSLKCQQLGAFCP